MTNVADRVVPEEAAVIMPLEVPAPFRDSEGAARRRHKWAILTGEYPPQPGGVSDYTRLVATALAERGDEVHVFAPKASAPHARGGGVVVHTLPDSFRLATLLHLGHQIDQLGPCSLLTQYVPHAFGYRAMNVPFTLWLWTRRHKNHVVTMFHEVAYPIQRGQPLRHHVIAVVNRLMAAVVLLAGHRAFVSTPSWRGLLLSLGASPTQIIDSPIFSNLPAPAEPQATSVARKRSLPGNGALVGHFGSFPILVRNMLDTVVPEVMMADATCGFVFIGRGSTAYAAALRHQHKALAPRIMGTGELTPEVAVEHMAACDIMLQPYPDGVTFRRASTMAALRLGLPLVTNLGHLSESLWPSTKAVLLAGSPASRDLARLTVTALADPGLRSATGLLGKALYDERFDIKWTVNRLIAATSSATVRACAH